MKKKIDSTKITQESAGEISPAPFSNVNDHNEQLQFNEINSIEKIPAQCNNGAKESEEKLKEAETAIKSRKSKKSKVLSLVFLLVNIGIVAVILVTQLKTTGVAPLNVVFNNYFNWWMLLSCFLAFAVINILTTLKYSVLLKKATSKMHFGLAYKTHAIGRYYDCVTPLATGGQPFQIYYMNKRGIKASDAMSVSLGKYVFQQVSYVVFCSVILIIFAILSHNKTSVGGASGVVVSVASYIGLALNLGLISVVAFLSLNKKAGTKLVGGFIKLGAKLKIVKNFEKTYKSVMNGLESFQNTMKYYAKSPKTFIISFLLPIFSIFINFALPFLIYSTFAGFNLAIFPDIFIKCVMIDLAMSFIPLPGGSGMAEFSFTALFASFFTGGVLFWALILWRILTYYGYIMQGMIIMVYDYAYGNRRYDWLSKKWKLEKESEEFKSTQLSYFKKKTKRIKKV